MNSKLLLIFSMISFAWVSGFAQLNKSDLNPCGTEDGISTWLHEFQQNIDGYPESGDLLIIPVKVHIVGTDEGAGYFPVNSVLSAFCQLNEDFLPTDIQFFISGDFNYIDETDYYDHNWQNGAEMMELNNVDNTINCYIVESPAGNCGYSSYNRGIALAKSCTGPNDHTWAHEIGHYLSLPHPFFGWEGVDHDYNTPAPNTVNNGWQVERMDGSNCANSGDGFCDTPPDYLNYRWGCDGGNLSNQIQFDPDNVEFYSDGSLFMSYAFDQCQSRFSEDQIAAMRANLNYERSNLLGQADPIAAVDTVFLNPVSPVPGDTLDVNGMVTFEWEQVPNATHYVVEISTFPDFPFVLFSYVTLDNTITVTDLFRNKNYYWRIRAFNNQHTCQEETSEVFGFRTGDDAMVSSVQTIEEVSALSLFPNPVNSGQSLLIDLTVTEALYLNATLVSITGQTIRQFPWQVSAGQNRLMVETGDLQTGMYFLRVNSDSGTITRKVVVN